jgi:hypothetical protein
MYLHICDLRIKCHVPSFICSLVIVIKLKTKDLLFLFAFHENVTSTSWILIEYQLPHAV